MQAPASDGVAARRAPTVQGPCTTITLPAMTLNMCLVAPRPKNPAHPRRSPTTSTG